MAAGALSPGAHAHSICGTVVLGGCVIAGTIAAVVVVVISNVVAGCAVVPVVAEIDRGTELLGKSPPRAIPRNPAITKKGQITITAIAEAARRSLIRD